MATTRVPEVVDALILAVQTALPDVQVLDGHPQGTAGLQSDVVVIAAGGIQAPSVLVAQTVDDSLCDPEETGRIICVASSWSGDVNAKAVRDRAAVLLAGVESAVRDDRKLGGTVSWADLGGQMSWALAHTDKGSIAEVGFEVTYRAFL